METPKRAPGETIEAYSERILCLIRKETARNIAILEGRKAAIRRKYDLNAR